MLPNEAASYRGAERRMRLQQDRRESCSGALNGVDGQAGTQRMKHAEDEELGIVLLEELDGAWRRDVGT